MNTIKFILFVITVNGIWTQTQAIKKMGKNAIIPVSCVKDDNCIKYFGAGTKCKNSFCICENEELCNPHKAEARTKSNVIGEDCAEDFNCNIQFAICIDGYCACISDRVASNDGRKCLDVSGGLGQACEEDIQCIRKIQGSVCRESICVCDDAHHQNSSECFQKVALGQACTLQSQCTHIQHAHCGKVFCDCDSGFVVSASRDKCLPVATKLLDKCEETEQCRSLHKHGAVCMYGKCECDAVHRLANASDCPTRLKQFCTTDDECKSYTEDPTMHCDMERCECKLPYFEQDGVCNGIGNTICTVYSIIPALMIILKLQYK